MKKNLLLLSAILMASFAVFDGYAQKKGVEGVVADEGGNPVKNVRIGVVNTKILEKTDKKGEFRLKGVLPTDSVVVYQKEGKGAKFLLGDAGRLQLKVSSGALEVGDGKGAAHTVTVDELVFKRYGSGSVITAQMIERNGYLTIKEAVKACIPGVSFEYSDEGERILIRGSKSLNLSTDPLVIVDGAETTFAAADQGCHVNDVELIEVVKDGLGYGAKGANGVIIIKTKK